MVAEEHVALTMIFQQAFRTSECLRFCVATFRNFRRVRNEVGRSESLSHHSSCVRHGYFQVLIRTAIDGRSFGRRRKC